MLVLDSTIGCIEADESQVLVLYRSVPIVMTPAPGSRPTSMEAFICATQGKSQTKVHLALVADNRRIYVYLETLKSADPAVMERSIHQAVSCARSMGFQPEPVDLAYRPAMREVVLRNIKVLRLPGSKAVASLKPGLPGAPILPVASPTGTYDDKTGKAPEKSAGITPAPTPSAPAASAPAASAPAASASPLAAVAPPAGSASVSAAPATADGPGLSRGERSSVGILQLQKDLQMMAAERDALLAQVQHLSVVHQEVVMELTAQRDEATRVTADIDRLARSEEQLKETVAERDSLRSELQDFAVKLQESQRLAEELRGDHSGLTGQLAAAKEESRELRGQLAAAKGENKDLSGKLAAAKDENKDLIVKLAAAKDEAKTLLAERKSLIKKGEAAAAQHEKVMEENRALHGELDELRTDREAESDRMSSLEQDLYTLASELGTATAEAEAARAELAAAVTRAATAEAELVVTRSKVVAAESKGAAIWRKLKATELELENSRAELAARGSGLSAPLPPAASVPESTVDSAAPPARGREKPGKAEFREAGSRESQDLESSETTELAPIEFEEPAPSVPEQAPLPKQTPLAKQAPVQEKAPVPDKEPVPDKAPVQDKAQVSTPGETAPSTPDLPHTAPAAHRQPAPVGGSEEKAPEVHPADPRALQGVGQPPDQPSSWYGVAANSFEPAFADPLPESLGSEPGQQEATSASPKAHEFPPFGDLQESFFSAAEDSAPVGQFVLRPDLKMIEYLRAEDVVELHQSINHAHMAPDGKGQESCRGYICSLRCGGKLQVFAAIYGTRSGRTCVYSPEVQPEDEAGYAGAMRSAISFAEEVGLMMEPVKGGTAALQDDSIVQCPVLKKAA